MLEQELKPEAKPRPTLRETERRRFMRNRLLGAGVAVSLAVAGISAVRRALPQWINMPGNASTAPVKSAALPAADVNAVPAAVSARTNILAARSRSAGTAKPVSKIQNARHAPVRPVLIAPEILPPDEIKVHRSKRRRHRSTPSAAVKIPNETAPSKRAVSDAPAPKSTEPVHPEPTSKPPDDVPDNP